MRVHVVLAGSVKKRFTTVTLVVDDYKKAIDWYTKVLEFEVVNNEARPGGSFFKNASPRLRTPEPPDVTGARPRNYPRN